MAILEEYQANITHDKQSGHTMCYLLRLSDAFQWEWVADTEFGPFDTAHDISRWLTRQLTKALSLPLR